MDLDEFLTNLSLETLQRVRSEFVGWVKDLAKDYGCGTLGDREYIDLKVYLERLEYIDGLIEQKQPEDQTDPSMPMGPNGNSRID